MISYSRLIGHVPPPARRKPTINHLTLKQNKHCRKTTAAPIIKYWKAVKHWSKQLIVCLSFCFIHFHVSWWLSVLHNPMILKYYIFRELVTRPVRSQSGSWRQTLIMTLTLGTQDGPQNLPVHHIQQLYQWVPAIRAGCDLTTTQRPNKLKQLVSFTLQAIAVW